MNYFFRFEYVWVLFLLLPIVFAAVAWKLFFYKNIKFSYSLVQEFKKKLVPTNFLYKYILYTVRSVVLIILAFLIAKPQRVDTDSKIPEEGIDIILVLDVSGSMDLSDFDQTKRSRFDIAKAEAIRFIQKRSQDAIGLVLFGKNAVSRCPLTLDKNLLQTVVQDIKLGDINPDGTSLIRGIVTAANRLKYSDAKSKIMIVLTDGEPSEGDFRPEVGIEVAQKMGIRVYTIGIGSDEEKVFMHPFYGMVTMPKVNKKLLDRIASETSGKSFMAHNTADMRAIYDTIDSLEKTVHEKSLFSRYTDLYQPYGLAVLIALAAETLLTTFVWFAL